MLRYMKPMGTLGLIAGLTVWMSGCGRECRTRLEMIVTFLALLELLKMNRLVAAQTGNFGAIELSPPLEPAEEGDADGRA